MVRRRRRQQGGRGAILFLFLCYCTHSQTFPSYPCPCFAARPRRDTTDIITSSNCHLQPLKISLFFSLSLSFHLFVVDACSKSLRKKNASERSMTSFMESMCVCMYVSSIVKIRLGARYVCKNQEMYSTDRSKQD